jgi:hypothetical protein
MNANDEHQDVVHNSAYNPFPQPQTFPSGWDTSEMLSRPQPVPVESLDDKPNEVDR